MLNNIRYEFKLSTILNSTISGLLVGTIALVNAVTYGFTVFAPTGEPSMGIQMSLISGLILSVLFGFLGSLSGMVALPQAAVVPVFAALVTSIVGVMKGQSPEAINSTVLAAIALASLTMGIACLILGSLRLGVIIRYMPVPVSGGFLAGLGWLLLNSGYKTAVGEKFLLETALQNDHILLWAPALVLGILLFIIQQKKSWSWMTPVLVIVSVSIFYLIVSIIHPVPLDELRQTGWLLKLSQSTSRDIFQFPLSNSYSEINWVIILRQSVTAMILLFTALIGLLMNINGIEMAVKEDINPNREMLLSGIGNIASMAVGGGIVGYPAAALTSMTYQRGKPGRLTNVIIAGLFGMALYYGLGYVSYLPMFVLGGLLFSMGINFIYEWIIQGVLKFSFADYLVVLGMFITVAKTELIYGVVLGIMLTGVIFVIRYSKTDVVRSFLTGKTFQSNVDRPIMHVNFLKEHGNELLILRLQGFIFFGTAHSIYKQAKTRLDESKETKVKFLVLDFAQTSGVDSSAALVFNKMKTLAEKENFELVFCALGDTVQTKLERNHFTLEGRRFHIFENLDHATEWCESNILNSSSLTVVTSSGLMSNIGEYFSKDEYGQLFKYMERKDVAEGDKLFTQGDEAGMLYFIERGRVTVYRELSNGRRVRLRRMGAGMVVGEIGMYLGGKASATVTADFPSELYVLMDSSLKQMESKEPALAARFHRYIIRLLGQRLQSMNSSVQALLD